MLGVDHDENILLSIPFQPSQRWVNIVVVMKLCYMLDINDVVCSVPVSGSKRNVLSVLPPVMLYVKDALSRSVALTWSSRSPGLVDSFTSI